MPKTKSPKPLKDRIFSGWLKKHLHSMKDKLEEPEENYTTYQIQLHNPTSNQIKSVKLSQSHSDDTAGINLLDPGQSSDVFLFKVKGPWEGNPLFNEDSLPSILVNPYPNHHAALNIDYKLDGESGKAYFVPPYAWGARKVKIDITFGAVGIVSKPIREIRTHKVRFTNKGTSPALEIRLGHMGSGESVILESLEPGVTSEEVEFSIVYPLPDAPCIISWAMLNLQYVKDGKVNRDAGSLYSDVIRVVIDDEGSHFEYSQASAIINTSSIKRSIPMKWSNSDV